MSGQAQGSAQAPQMTWGGGGGNFARGQSVGAPQAAQPSPQQQPINDMMQRFAPGQNPWQSQPMPQGQPPMMQAQGFHPPRQNFGPGAGSGGVPQQPGRFAGGLAGMLGGMPQQPHFGGFTPPPQQVSPFGPGGVMTAGGGASSLPQQAAPVQQDPRLVRRFNGGASQIISDNFNTR